MLGAKNSDTLAEEKRQAQSSTTVCDEDTGSCEMSVCDNKLLCETLSIPKPSDTEPLIGDDGEPDDDVPLGYIPWLIE